MAKFRKFDPNNKKKRRDREYMERDRKIKPFSKRETRADYQLTRQWEDEYRNFK